jgi:hypothetical protein
VSNTDLRDWYNKASAQQTGVRNLSPQQANEYLDLLRVPFDKQFKLLEANFGDGTFLEQAMKRVDCVGVSPRVEEHKAASQRLGEAAGPGTLVQCALTEMRKYPAKFHYLFVIGHTPTKTECQVIHILLHRDGQYCVVDAAGTVKTGVREKI